MTRNLKIALLFLAAFAISFASIPARTQTVSAPMVIKSSPPPAVKPIKSRFEVLRMMINAIQVRNPENVREIHTFTYSDQIRGRMQAVFNNGGYQYGDKVVIHYMPHSDVALNIEGKPSKPL